MHRLTLWLDGTVDESVRTRNLHHWDSIGRTCIVTASKARKRAMVPAKIFKHSSVIIMNMKIDLALHRDLPCFCRMLSFVRPRGK